MSAADTPQSRLRADTVERILAAAFERLRDEPEAPFSHEIVAERAGVSARTVYRHFPTQSDLVRGVWQQLRDRTGTTWPRTLETIIPELRGLFAQFERNNALTRAMLAAAPRANYSQHGSAEGRAAFREALAPLLVHRTPGQQDQLIAQCVAIYSAPFWQMLRDRGQLSAPAAAEAAVHAMTAVLTAAKADAKAKPSKRPKQS
ncbi:MAG: TetR/AcrR family transcriptional regulator [Gemmatimonadaceae bacterium]|nr:TetR/AcrR family transcriptional regulator [Gemmatimonadaceae bacterium]